jgi:hypothetical protein
VRAFYRRKARLLAKIAEAAPASDEASRAATAARQQLAEIEAIAERKPGRGKG